ncbi:RraA family protein [Actinomadura sp. KC06]|uniref:RraA family protein n=1 Tax=Actinomadura sp. KC06 TaxID=2530369 RepID=UPI0010482F95|nr:RraA family protein [Actinomadura sp. KC06]TDD38175.1 RraA family protein [Actinomadura sp. KC06]
MTDHDVGRLSRLDTCLLSDALAAESVPGVPSGLVPVIAGRSFAGRAVTVDLGPAGSADPAGSATAAVRHLGTAALDAAAPGTVIVVAHHGMTSVAGWGGILSRGAVRAGVAGIVVDGAVRDVDEIHELGLAVHAAAVTPRSARGTVVERGWNCEIDVQGVTVAPGDLVRADGSGVVIVPASVAGRVLDTAERLAEKEAAMAAAVQDGVAMSQVMGAAYEGAIQARPHRHERT